MLINACKFVMLLLLLQFWCWLLILCCSNNHGHHYHHHKFTIAKTHTLYNLQYLNNQKLRNELMDIDNLTVERIEDLAEYFLKSVKDKNTSEKNKWTSQYRIYSVSKILMNAYS